ncbi:MAG: glucuronate isomerase, partial [Lentisphaeria bacterium]|nr:glucuronate isomerase [Lentisphaeria bacterium]
MSNFLSEHYLLSNKSSESIYSEINALPILDPHNHADVKEIAENEPYPDIWQIEGATDHYVWSLMRKFGIDEDLITGSASPEEKWQMLGNIFEEIAGNPTYEWIHLDLKRILAIDDNLSSDTAGAIFKKAREILSTEEMRPQSILKKMNIEAMCSTDDPIDSLEYHQSLNADSSIAGLIRPTFRPDAAMNIFKAEWLDYISKFEERVNTKFKSISDLI